ncbi:NAD(P)H-binding protein [Alteromonas sp. RKMC-009]|uniref:NAD(P)H-binding protein n=1 Tax=Alteromonas sp. RKMC-009 TaxID=2267264 RepID=UPI000C664236|nr:NAD(P)H-binding protein [Alteromonas sp. RKMC-009]AYA65709.1 NAD-dependent epimerase/dehydratase family protein [Alteromonas sp. RKMC-009]MBT79979.1 epimerase [Alteromonadaceae bacterium]MEC7690045.1 NAD(P)H-binding protein [Pseudomonadota bacterium]
MNSNKTALVLGATGLVGKALVRQLLLDPRYDSITILVRRPVPASLFSDPLGKLTPLVIDFEQLQDYQGYFSVNHVYCCLGTTLKQAGSKAAFRKVDFEYIHVAAQLTRAQRADSFVWISSVGANAKSSNFYLRVKGELEDALMRMPQLPNASAVRPSLLLGERNESRPLEAFGQMIAPALGAFMAGPLKKYRPVSATEVAHKMITLQEFDSQ